MTPAAHPADAVQARRPGTVVRLHLKLGFGYVRDDADPASAYILPTCITVAGEERFDVASLQEPARTGFARHLAATRPTVTPTLRERLSS